MFEKVNERIAQATKPKPKGSIAVFIDGPNILRKELGVDLGEVKRLIGKFGKIKIGKVFLNQYANNKLIEAVVNQGFESVITVGDIDVSMAADAVEAVYNPTINTIAFVTRDSDFLPAIVKAKRAGKETIVVLAEEASAAALKNNADQVIVLK
ncbi:TIGR00288 family NYN domain-containing protein [Candidatus Micrarchaeota archaeon]|nr:TIGR00288 family NYN domain-containing protein [Candidatus Micrarchaeota archaeon]